jgi:hypothetical protein
MMQRSNFHLRCGWSPLLRGLALVATVACAASPAQAQWKWRDAQGRIQYSDRPPPTDVRDRDILQRPAAAVARPATVAPAASGAASGPVATSDAALEARKRQTEGGAPPDKAKRDEEDRATRQRAENCTRARDYARSLDAGTRIARINDKGEHEVLDDAQRARESAKAREVIANDCR